MLPLLSPPPAARHGHRLVSNGPLIQRLLRAAVGFLEEGSLEARTSGKRILWEARRLMDVSLGPDEFRRALGRLEVKTDKVGAAPGCWRPERGTACCTGVLQRAAVAECLAGNQPNECLSVGGWVGRLGGWGILE